MAYKSIGIVGGGVIGQALFEYVSKHDSLSVEYVLVSDVRRSKRQGAITRILTDDVDAALSQKVDLVLEAANPDFLHAHASRILESSSLCGFSCSALATEATEDAILASAGRSGRRFYLPHGGIFGLDGLIDGRPVLNSVTITTTKSGPSLGGAADLHGVVFDGSTRDACIQFPRNVNVHAAIAWAGLGFDRTRSIIVAEPNATVMTHQIRIIGDNLEWNITAQSRSLGGVTGSYTPKSAVGSVARILNSGIIANV